MVSSDYGASNERTAFAWQRTALSLVAGAAIVARLTYDRIGWLALANVLVAAPLALWVFWESRGRYEHTARVRRRARPRGGRAATALTVAVLTIAAAEFLALVAPG